MRGSGWRVRWLTGPKIRKRKDNAETPEVRKEVNLADKVNLGHGNELV
jgi:hypothetical protein